MARTKTMVEEVVERLAAHAASGEPMPRESTASCVKCHRGYDDGVREFITRAGSEAERLENIGLLNALDQYMRDKPGDEFTGHLICPCCTFDGCTHPMTSCKHCGRPLEAGWTTQCQGHTGPDLSGMSPAELDVYLARRRLDEAEARLAAASAPPVRPRRRSRRNSDGEPGVIPEAGTNGYPEARPVVATGSPSPTAIARGVLLSVLSERLRSLYVERVCRQPGLVAWTTTPDHPDFKELWPGGPVVPVHPDATCAYGDVTTGYDDEGRLVIVDYIEQGSCGRPQCSPETSAATVAWIHANDRDDCPSSCAECFPHALVPYVAPVQVAA